MNDEVFNSASDDEIMTNPDEEVAKAFLGDTDVSIEDDNEVVDEADYPDMSDFDIDLADANKDVDADQHDDKTSVEDVEEPDNTPDSEDDAYQYIDTEWLGESRKFDLKNEADRADAKQLLQKGRDYDRIREAYDVMSKDYADAKYALEVLESMKGEDFQSVADLVDDIVARNILNENGADVNDATIKSVMSSAKNKREESKKKYTMNAIREENANSKRDADVAHFLKTFPDVNSNQLTQDVWDDMRTKQISLTEAWLSKQNKELSKKISELDGQLKTEKQHNKNKSRSVGSAKSTSASAELNDFFSGMKEVDDW